MLSSISRRAALIAAFATPNLLALGCSGAGEPRDAFPASGGDGVSGTGTGAANGEEGGEADGGGDGDDGYARFDVAGDDGGEGGDGEETGGAAPPAALIGGDAPTCATGTARFTFPLPELGDTAGAVALRDAVLAGTPPPQASVVPDQAFLDYYTFEYPRPTSGLRVHTTLTEGAAEVADLQLAVLTPPAAERPATDVVVLIAENPNPSGAVDENGAALAVITDQLREDDRLSVIGISADAPAIAQESPEEGSKPDLLKRALIDVEPQRATVEAIATAVDIAKNAEGSAALVVLGAQTIARDRALLEAFEAAHGLRVAALVADDGEGDPLAELAALDEVAPGVSLLANSAEEVERTLGARFDALTSVAARDITVEIQLPEGLAFPDHEAQEGLPALGRTLGYADTLVIQTRLRRCDGAALESLGPVAANVTYGVPGENGLREIQSASAYGISQELSETTILKGAAVRTFARLLRNAVLGADLTERTALVEELLAQLAPLRDASLGDAEIDEMFAVVEAL